ncbi:hypothetical protein A3D80_02095 [Candidatus Roizmanbacteria bacterium RIFCSPHIGHO2_02_FULL_40_13b]|uniref:Peptidase M24 domain-containing protein n=1 Tax=Candidatus Roizmanbacteria bacterium RIFCSPHIGHO2_01_FULL_39_24 TaxID=1802032 RepID=A0A1F7GGN0_9BACT|nr:MAG: hypothetical protein A2799_04745 [Candidatus Roizmanbacteria bacterium RIFCSPHIGHO2_01_FULL_39_24]OGK26626.1 MAG: hypothetical protein A3D80_02095 [Candidatus Roizmanbacteria bacterium RIFCSPHIGHO2_02_FULL_40_13b]OGK48951.1 MAG: hypothetical protein A3A56_02610 [Candidatus Roizmanbacteria bacterium RIFCSPLOWO2_01_FULL_40_32]
MRIQSLQSILQEKKVSALLVTTPSNIYYLCGFGIALGERSAYMLVTQKSVYFFTDSRYVSERLKADLKRQKIVLKIISREKNLSVYLLEISKAEKIKSFYFEHDDLSVAEFEWLKEKKVPMHWDSIVPPTAGLQNDRLIESMRTKKDPEEIKAIKKACELVDLCLSELLPYLHVGISEKEVLRILSRWFINNSPTSFDPIVAIDENAAIPHYDTQTNGEKVAKSESIMLIDCGISYNRYASDITRMFAFGTPSQRIRKAYEILKQVQDDAVVDLSQMKFYKEADEKCRNSLKTAGFPPFEHALGHGIGIDVHELPHFSPRNNDTIEEGHVVTVEPGIYILGAWGMRLEDTVVVGKNKQVIRLTKTSREMIII